MPAAKSGEWWVTPKPNPAAVLDLFCFPYAGGNASVFRSWPAAMPDAVQLHAIQPPGRANRIRDPLIASVAEFVNRFAPALVAALDRPFVFFGHSMGAILSFEVARWLRDNGHPLPRHLFVSGRRAPHLPDTDPPIYGKSDSEFVAEIGKINGTPKEVLEHPELLQILLPSLRADFQLCETYQPAPQDDSLPVPITAFGGGEDEETEGDRLAAWQRHTTSMFTAHVLPGGHFFLHSAERMLLTFLRTGLTRIAYAGAFR